MTARLRGDYIALMIGHGLISDVPVGGLSASTPYRGSITRGMALRPAVLIGASTQSLGY